MTANNDFIDSPTLQRELVKFLVELVADSAEFHAHSRLLVAYVSFKKYVDVCLR